MRSEKILRSLKAANSPRLEEPQILPALNNRFATASRDMLLSQLRAGASRQFSKSFSVPSAKDLREGDSLVKLRQIRSREAIGKR